MKEEFEDIKGVIGIRKLKKDRQHNCQKKKRKLNNNVNNSTNINKNERSPLTSNH